ncbi:BspA family leucine-rich repeat surface protein [Mycoplasma mycoides subsp. capri]|uniref:BspA family leucine-rich repeat surface protein n=1 Tax=Mycoplasma mycoides TaxID=2102 RepID=UPI0022405A85|nr:BspA family leucine-rich repeat surface protein [Mycoplasma mycoides]UZK64146.1 BspA family leucine-rich repeat surface protein [Mycoplasma mycoides subsp. capri]
MKKLLTFLSSFGLIVISSLLVISCKNNNINASKKENHKDNEHMPSDQSDNKKVEKEKNKPKPKRLATEEEKNKLEAIFKEQENAFGTFHTYKDVVDQLLVYANEKGLKDITLADGLNEDEYLKEDKDGKGRNIVKLKLYGSDATFKPKKVLKDEVETIYSEDKKKVKQIGYKKIFNKDIKIKKITELIEEVPVHLPLKITSLSEVFSESKIKTVRNLDKWNTKNIKSMFSVFENAKTFNQDISNWDTSNVTNMSGMFKDTTQFNQSLNEWKVHNVVEMEDMFAGASSFNQNLNKWKTTSLENMKQMFWDASKFNGDISTWDVSNVKTLYNTFADATSFNQDISNWITSNVTTMEGTFSRANKFSYSLTRWNVEKVTTTKDFNKGIQNTLGKDKLPKFTVPITYS